MFLHYSGPSNRCLSWHAPMFASFRLQHLVSIACGLFDLAFKIEFVAPQRLTACQVLLETKAVAENIVKAGFDDVIVATGVVPRPLSLPGAPHPKVGLSMLAIRACYS